MSGNQQAFQNAMSQGHSAAWDQEWEKAATYYQVAINEFPNDLIALTSLALAYFELQKYPEALAHYQQAATQAGNDPVPAQKIAEIYQRMADFPNASSAYMHVAEMYLHNKNVEKAIQSWLHVVAINPDHMNAHTRLALVYERLGRTSEAMHEFIVLASLLQKKGDIAKAVQTLRHALQVVPNSKEASQALTMLLNGQALPQTIQPHGDTGLSAVPQVRRSEVTHSIVNSNPKVDPIQDAKQKAMTMLAELLFEQEEAQNIQARRGLNRIVRGKNSVDHPHIDQAKIITHLSQAIDLQSHGEDAQSALELERAVNSGLDNSAAYFILGFLQSKSEKFDSAVENIRKALQHEFFAFGARLLLALTLYKMEAIKEASVEYLQALRIADSESVSADQAEELSQLYEPLIESYIQLSDEKLNKRICENISKLLIRTDWKEQIRRAREQIPAQQSTTLPVPLAEMLTEATSSQLVESLAKVNQLARAKKLLSAMEEAFHALKYAPGYLPLHIYIGDLLLQENRVPEAVHKYSIVARSYRVRGDANRAIALLKRVSELAPTIMDSRNDLIQLLISRGKGIEAVQEYIKLAETYNSQADLAMARSTYSQALNYAQETNASRELKAKLLHRMADIDIQSLEIRDAIRIFEQIKSIDPDDAEARSLLFDLNLRTSQLNQAMSELDSYLNHLFSLHRSGEALEFINSKIADNQKQPALYRRLAEIYRLLGRKEDAVSQLEIAKEMFLLEGNRSAAIESVTSILALNPPNPDMYQRMLVELQTTS